MKRLPEKGLVYKTCRISYISNYFIIVLVAILFLILLPYLKFNLNPKTLGEFLPTLGTLGFLILLTFLFEQPAIERWIRHYVVTNDEVVKVEGLLRKRKIAIPYQSVADLRFEKGVVGRIFNFGNVYITGFGKENSILMKGMHNPEEVYNIIRNKINLMRKTVIRRKSFSE